MKTRCLASFVVVVAIVAVSSMAYSQGNMSVLFDGTALVNRTNFLGDSDFNQMKAKKPVFPGVEVRFNQKGYVSFGIGYQKINLKSDSEHMSRLIYQEVSGGVVVKEAYTTFDQSAEASANAVLATLYVNLTTRGKVRPFVGGGGGFAQFDKVMRDYNGHTDLAQLPNQYIQDMLKYNPGLTPHDLEFPPDNTDKEKTKQVLIKGVGGVNLYPVKYLVISIAGGYINGPALNFGAGVTF